MGRYMTNEEERELFRISQEVEELKQAANLRDQANAAVERATNIYNNAVGWAVHREFDEAVRAYWPTPGGELSEARLQELREAAKPAYDNLCQRPEFFQAVERGDLSSIRQLASLAVVEAVPQFGQQLMKAVEMQDEINRNPHGLSPRELVEQDWEMGATTMGLQAAKEGHPGGVKPPVRCAEAVAFEIGQLRSQDDWGDTAENVGKDLVQR